MTWTNEFGQPVGDPVPAGPPRPRAGAGRASRAGTSSLEPLAPGTPPTCTPRCAAPGRRRRCGPTGRPSRPPTSPAHGAADRRARRRRRTWSPSRWSRSAARRRASRRTCGSTRRPAGRGRRRRSTPGRLQRTRAATEAIHLVMRHAFDDLGYRRFEWKCDSLNEPSRRAARAAGLHLRGPVPQPHGRQGPQPRHRLVLGHRRRVAGRPRRARAVAATPPTSTPTGASAPRCSDLTGGSATRQSSARPGRPAPAPAASPAASAAE